MPKGGKSTDKVQDMGVLQIIEAYRTGSLKPTEAVQSYIRHHERFNDSLNLVVEKRYAEALREAEYYDEQWEKGSVKGRLWGVPISMKESFQVKGMHLTGGLSHRADIVSDEDSEAVKKLKAEGAIILCKTNTPTLCFCQETDNLLFGRSNNPWNTEMTTGGSSGGEAALIAVGGAAAGFGSDIGGSIRIPSHFNGVVGFKPGDRRFPDGGHFGPETTPHQVPMRGYGPITKSVRDAALIYECIYPEFKKPKSWNPPKKTKIISFGNFHKTRCSSETLDILKRAKDHFRKIGMDVINQVPPFAVESPKAWQLIMAEDAGNGVIAEAYPDNPFGFIPDYVRARLGLNPKVHHYLSWGIMGTKLFPPSAKQLRWCEEFIERGNRWIRSELGKSGVLLTPLYPTPAKNHGKIYAEIFSVTMSYNQILPFVTIGNVFAIPSIVVPCGFSKEGLPIGLQVTAPMDSEGLMFQVAAQLESAFGGYWRRTVFD